MIGEQRGDIFVGIRYKGAGMESVGGDGGRAWEVVALGRSRKREDRRVKGGRERVGGCDKEIHASRGPPIARGGSLFSGSSQPPNHENVLLRPLDNFMIFLFLFFFSVGSPICFTEFRSQRESWLGALVCHWP